jgi:methyl-accepting chemotaxis protein
MKKCSLLFLFISFVLFAQLKDVDVSSDVKGLMEFHEVIYQMYHTGLPQKNIKFLNSLNSVIEKDYAILKNSELPGILIDKKSKWEKGLTKLGVFVDLYRVACMKKDSVALLHAAEKLHSQFEAIVKITKPELKEIEAFHKNLYILHYICSTQYDYEKIKVSASALKENISDLSKAHLPVRLKKKQDEFNKVIIEIISLVEKLDQVVTESNNKPVIGSAIDMVYSKYNVLVKLFD